MALYKCIVIIIMTGTRRPPTVLTVCHGNLVNPTMFWHWWSPSCWSVLEDHRCIRSAPHTSTTTSTNARLRPTSVK